MNWRPPVHGADWSLSPRYSICSSRLSSPESSTIFVLSRTPVGGYCKTWDPANFLFSSTSKLSKTVLHTQKLPAFSIKSCKYISWTHCYRLTIFTVYYALWIQFIPFFIYQTSFCPNDYPSNLGNSKSPYPLSSFLSEGGSSLPCLIVNF